MDGNGRWATARRLPRVAGHKQGVEAVRATIESCGRLGIPYLTLFAFSSENWQRPADEVSTLMRLFVTALQREVGKLIDHGVRLRIVGERGAFGPELQRAMRSAEERTQHNQRLNLTICASYGGRWDIINAARAVLAKAPADRTGDPALLTEDALARQLQLAFAPELDLLIRTGGEQRISNFLLWQAAYAELYFTDVLWPDFDGATLEAAVQWYLTRERRFGRVGAPAVAAHA
jgi:undecaprenyl diphosphate synthase